MHSSYMIEDSISLTNEGTEDAPATASTPLICVSQGVPPYWCPETMQRGKKEEESVSKEGHGLFLLEPPCPLFGRYKEKVDVDLTGCKISKEERADIIKKFCDACQTRGQSRAKGKDEYADVLRKLSPPPSTPLSPGACDNQYVKSIRDIRPISLGSPLLSPGAPNPTSPSSISQLPGQAAPLCPSPNRGACTGSGESVAPACSSKELQSRWKKSFAEIRSIKLGEQEDTFIKNYDTLAGIIDDFSEKAKLYAQVIITEVNKYKISFESNNNIISIHIIIYFYLFICNDIIFLLYFYFILFF